MLFRPFGGALPVPAVLQQFGRRHGSSSGCMTNFYRLADQRARRRIVSFDRRELSRLLNLYSLRVASGEWRDYAIDFRPGMAIFSIFRHTAEQPLFAIAKVPGAAQGGYMVYNGPRKLAHGDSLEDVLKIFERKLRLLTGCLPSCRTADLEGLRVVLGLDFFFNDTANTEN